MSDQGQSPTREAVGQEPVWTYRGYRLRPGEFTTAMVHFFRAEISRANVWRQRLDTTTNWAVLTTGAAISFAFSDSTGDHRVIMLNMLLITLFLYIEARRYRYYELWSSRVRLMETDFFASMLVPPFHPASDWAGLAGACAPSVPHLDVGGVWPPFQAQLLLDLYHPVAGLGQRYGCNTQLKWSEFYRAPGWWPGVLLC
jgi:uncharacterized membrane protein